PSAVIVAKIFPFSRKSGCPICVPSTASVSLSAIRLNVSAVNIMDSYLEMDFRLHEGHPLRDDCKRNEIVSEKAAEVVDGFVIDLIDAQSEAANSIFRHDFAFESMDSLDEIVKLFEEAGVIRLRVHPGDNFAGKPASFVVRVENFEI